MELKEPKSSSWTFYTPNFSFINKCDDFTWFGHSIFVYDLVRNLKPKTIVELGTYRGTSISCFAEAVKDDGLNSELVAIDSWEGEVHTSMYGEEVFTKFKELIAEFFPKQNFNLKRKYFAEAVKEFKDKSIDILHIDGLHTYEAVKEDYELWKDKVSDEGVILFHDTQVREKDFGVWKFWEELLESNKDAVFFEFKHHYGLGVMVKSKELKKAFTPEFIKEILEYYPAKANEQVTTQLLLEWQNKRDRLNYDVLWHKSEELRNHALSEGAVRENGQLLEDLKQLSIEKGEYVTRYLEIHPHKPLNEIPSMGEIFRHNIDLQNAVAEKDNLLNRQAIRLFYKLDSANIFKNRYVRKVTRVFYWSLLRFKNLFNR